MATDQSDECLQTEKDKLLKIFLVAEIFVVVPRFDFVFHACRHFFPGRFFSVSPRFSIVLCHAVPNVGSVNVSPMRLRDGNADKSCLTRQTFTQALFSPQKAHMAGTFVQTQPPNQHYDPSNYSICIPSLSIFFQCISVCTCVIISLHDRHAPGKFVAHLTSHGVCLQVACRRLSCIEVN